MDGFSTCRIAKASRGGQVFRVIGIGLGTTNSLVAIFENGRPRCLANEFGEELTPSVVAVAGDGVLLVGRAAKDRLIVDPSSGHCLKPFPTPMRISGGSA